MKEKKIFVDLVNELETRYKSMAKSYFIESAEVLDKNDIDFDDVILNALLMLLSKSVAFKMVMSIPEKNWQSFLEAMAKNISANTMHFIAEHQDEIKNSDTR